MTDTELYRLYLTLLITQDFSGSIDWLSDWKDNKPAYYRDKPYAVCAIAITQRSCKSGQQWPLSKKQLLNHLSDMVDGVNKWVEA